MEEIKVGEYVRIKRGTIHKVLGIRNELRDGKRIYGHKAYYLDNYRGSLTKAYIVKHSFNLIDLIEVGDYVNGEEVVKRTGEVIATYCNEYITDQYFKSIVTKEQFKSVMYEV